MNKAERDFRLQAVREEKAELRKRLDELKRKLTAANARSEESIRRIKDDMRRPWYQRLFKASPSTFRLDEVLGEAGNALMADELEKRIAALTDQEARLIGMTDEKDPFSIRQHLR